MTFHSLPSNSTLPALTRKTSFPCTLDKSTAYTSCSVKCDVAVLVCILVSRLISRLVSKLILGGSTDAAATFVLDSVARVRIPVGFGGRRVGMDKEE